MSGSAFRHIGLEAGMTVILAALRGPRPMHVACCRALTLASVDIVMNNRPEDRWKGMERVFMVHPLGKSDSAFVQGQRLRLENALPVMRTEN